MGVSMPSGLVSNPLESRLPLRRPRLRQSMPADLLRMIGSSLQAMEVLRHPRWEDFDYKYLNDNPMGWFGDGWTANELNQCVNVDYLDDENIDFPPSGDIQVRQTLTNGAIPNGVEVY